VQGERSIEDVEMEDAQAAVAAAEPGVDNILSSLARLFGYA
jgi:hypothetical protein